MINQSFLNRCSLKLTKLRLSIKSKIPSIKQTLQADKEFRNLANSNPAFKNVLQIKKHGTYGTTTPRGSCVYIGNNLLLTSAHCFFDKKSNSGYNKKYLQQFSFNETDENGEIVKSYKATAIYTHPNFNFNNNNTTAYDIAVIKIKGDILLPGIKPSLYRPRIAIENAISVGYPTIYGPKDTFSYPFFKGMSMNTNKRAVKVPYCTLVRIGSCSFFINILGKDIILKYDDKVVKSNKLIREIPSDYLPNINELPDRHPNILESGTNSGMSGGLLFSNNKFVAIPCRHLNQGDVSSLHKKFSNRKSKDIDGFIPLYRHRKWLNLMFHFSMQKEARKRFSKQREARKLRLSMQIKDGKLRSNNI